MATNNSNQQRGSLSVGEIKQDFKDEIARLQRAADDGPKLSSRQTARHDAQVIRDFGKRVFGNM